MEIEGKVEFLRDESKDCVCCKGNHIFSQSVKWEMKEDIHPAFHDDYLRGVLHKFIRDKENKKIKITIECIEHLNSENHSQQPDVKVKTRLNGEGEVTEELKDDSVGVKRGGVTQYPSVDTNHQKRADGRVEWVCEHGVGHTIKVPKEYENSKAWWSHGCDGCCSNYFKKEVKEND